MLQYQVHIRLKEGVSDPQGSATINALKHAGFAEAADARIGKIVDMTIDETDTVKAEKRLHDMCAALLVNDVIETYSIIKV